MNNQSIEEEEIFPAKWMEDVPKAIEESKLELRKTIPDLKERFNALNDFMLQEVKSIQSESKKGNVIPTVDFNELEKLPQETINSIHKKGCVVIRNVFSKEQAESWDTDIAEYINSNNYEEKSVSKQGLDKYFDKLQSSKPQIFSLYWSKAQMEARQHPNLANVRRYLNNLWSFQDGNELVFDPNRECTYADRVRRRAPGAVSLGLSPHIDGGSVERWCDPSFRYVYRDLLFGDVHKYNPYDSRGRTKTLEIPSPAVASAFRTYQGWTALSSQGPEDGTLQLLPSVKSMGWALLRALQDDVPADNLCDAAAGRALPINEKWHQLLIDGMVSIPHMEPGDTVWWHPDLVHAVKDQHKGKNYSDVVYIASAPYCDKNTKFLSRQAKAFKEGRSSPDFAAEDYEIDFVGRATENDLSELGKCQMGLKEWAS